MNQQMQTMNADINGKIKQAINADISGEWMNQLMQTLAVNEWIN